MLSKTQKRLKYGENTNCRAVLRMTFFTETKFVYDEIFFRFHLFMYRQPTVEQAYQTHGVLLAQLQAILSTVATLGKLSLI